MAFVVVIFMGETTMVKKSANKTRLTKFHAKKTTVREISLSFFILSNEWINHLYIDTIDK